VCRLYVVDLLLGYCVDVVRRNVVTEVVKSDVTFLY